MALVINDRVRETSTTTGTGTFTLAGAVTGFETFSSAIGNTNTTYYAISNQANGEFEVGLGTVGAGTLARTTIISSSNSDSAVNFSAGTKDVFCTLPASKAVILDSSGNIVANNGSNLTNLNADNLATGTVANARLDAELAAIGGLTSAADKGIQFTGVGTAGTFDLTTAGKALLDDADAAAQRTTLGLGSIAELNTVTLTTDTTGDYVASITAGEGITGAASGEGSTPTLAIDLNELTTSTADADGDFFAVVDSVGAQKKLTKGNIAISGFNNDSGFIDGSSLNASNLSSGTVPDARFPATLPAISGANLTNLDASDLASGTVPDARFPATLPAASGVNLTSLNATNIASGTLASDRLPTVPTTKGGTGLTTIGSANQVLAVNGAGTALEYQTPTTGDITGVTAGNGLTGGGSSGDVTLNVGAGNLIDVQADQIDVDLSELTTSTADTDGDFFVVVDNANAQKKLTKGNINISGFNNDSGFTTNTGTVTSVSGGNGLTGTVTTSGSLAVGAGTLIDVTADAVNVDLSELTTSTADTDGDFFVVVDNANAQKKLTKGNINISGFNNDAGYTTNTGDITGVTAGNGLTGGGASGSVTLNVGAGTGIDVAADAISVDVSDFMSNGSNNRIVTATGTDAMNAESDLIYDGNLGVGETSPSSKLHVKSSNIISSEFESTNTFFSRIKVSNGTSAIPYFGSFTSDARINGSSVVFEDSQFAAERMRITQSGGSTRVGIATASPGSTLDVNGSLSKSSGSFKIDHPLESKKNTHYLVHSFVEAPQADNIYRGKINLVNGTATVNIDTVAGMSEGTFVLLNREIQCFTSNETGWTAVKGSVSGNILTITAQDNTCTDTISWMVIGERHDDHMYDTEWTDENGKVIVEPLK